MRKISPFTFRNIVIMITICIAIFTAPISARASTTIFGNGGLAYIPTGEVTPHYTARFGFAYVGSAAKRSGIGFGGQSHLAQFSFGLFPNMDAGISVFEDSAGETQFAAHTKIVLLPQLGDTQVSVAAGVWDAFGDHDFSPYITVGKRINFSTRVGAFHDAELSLNLGYGGGIYGNSVFAGAGFKTSDFEIMVDAAGDFVNGGASYRYGPFYAGAKFIDFSDSVFTLGVDWALQ